MGCGCSASAGGGASAPGPTVGTPVTLLARNEDVLKGVELSSVGNGQGQRYLQERAKEFTSAQPTIGPVAAESIFGGAAFALCCRIPRLAGFALLVFASYLLYRFFSRGSGRVAADAGLS